MGFLIKCQPWCLGHSLSQPSLAVKRQRLIVVLTRYCVAIDRILLVDYIVVEKNLLIKKKTCQEIWKIIAYNLKQLPCDWYYSEKRQNNKQLSKIFKLFVFNQCLNCIKQCELFFFCIAAAINHAVVLMDFILILWFVAVFLNRKTSVSFVIEYNRRWLLETTFGFVFLDKIDRYRFW